MKLINKLEKKYGKYAIHNLMYYIIVLYVVGFIMRVAVPGVYEAYFSLDPVAIMHGQIWRMFTFIMYPPSTKIFYFLLGIYLYYVIGKTLEYQWGAFRFNLYFFTGVVLHIVAAFLSNYVFGLNIGPMFGTYYLNFSLFFAFAATYPDMQFLLFFIIPIKAKHLGYLNGIYFAVTIITGFLANHLSVATILTLMEAGVFPHPANSVMALVSLGNFLIYFFAMRDYRRFSPKQVKRRAAYNSQVKRSQEEVTHHKCAICGRTEKDGDHLEFRYCSKCDGNYEYCQDHLFTHEHVKK